MAIRMAALGLGLCLLALADPAAAGEPSVLRVAAGLPSAPITVVEDRAVVIESAVPFVEVSVARPEIVGVSPLSDRTIRIVGLGRGTTTLTLIGEGGRLVTNALVQVTPDVAAVRRAIEGMPAR